MRKLLLFAVALMALLSCTATKESKSVRKEQKNERKLANQQTVKKAVESGKFIINLDKIYFSMGGMADLVPRYNYIIINGNKAVISAAYLGKQFDIRPIAGISMRGNTDGYILNYNSSKGIYELKTKVSNERNSFDVFLSIGKDGSCNASISSMMIDVVRYRGRIAPIIAEEEVPVRSKNMI